MKKIYLAVWALSFIMLSSCGITKKDLGFSRQGPDASAVKTNEPLILPPEYSVRPSKNISHEDEGFYE